MTHHFLQKWNELQNTSPGSDCLPLGIITMARCMKGVDDTHESKNALEDMRQSKVGQDDMKKVFQTLRFSYTRLSDSALQRCFLY